MSVATSLSIALTATSLCLGQPLAAQETAPPPAQEPAAQRSGLLGEDELAHTRGGQTVIINQQQMSAVVAGTLNGDYVAGGVSFNDNALSNFSGVGNFTINTGAQNNLQTGMILTVTITD